MRVVGIDPGISHTGYGIVDAGEGGRLQYVTSGSIRTSARDPLVERLSKIHRELAVLFHRFRPHHMAVEQIFFSRNARSALILGQARGVALLSAALVGIPVYEYAATEIKQAVCRYGQASKQQVSAMVTALLAIAESVPSHASDALAVCICHIHSHQTLEARTTRTVRCVTGPISRSG